MKRLALLLALLAIGCGCAHHETAGKAPAGESDETEEKAVTAPPSTPTTAPSGATATGQPTTAPPAKAPPPKIKIVVRSNPPKATVFWGKKKLGETPVTFERPRDSGPIDLVVRNDGYFPVHTRAYTFKNDAMLVRMTKLDDRMTLPGAKHEAGETPDGGVPPPLPPPPTAPTVAPPQQ